MMGTTLAPPNWVRLQPQIAVVTALCMLAMGVYLLKDGKLALRIARIGALVYLGYGLLNGIVVPLEWDIPIAAFVSLLSTLIAVPTGLFLMRTIQNCGKRYA
jgi:lipopolysaccharide export LptBFGC system permease protein LptF